MARAGQEEDRACHKLNVVDGGRVRQCVDLVRGRGGGGNLPGKSGRGGAGGAEESVRRHATEGRHELVQKQRRMLFVKKLCLEKNSWTREIITACLFASAAWAWHWTLYRTSIFEASGHDEVKRYTCANHTPGLRFRCETQPGLLRLGGCPMLIIIFDK